MEKAPAPKSVPLKSEWFDQWGINSNTVYVVEVINKNEDLPSNKPDLGVIITKKDGDRVAHIIEAYDARVQQGDKITFNRDETPHYY